MQVIDFLAAFAAGVHHEAKAAIMAGCAAVVKGQLLHERHHSTQPGGVVGSDVGQRAHVVLRHHQQVNGRGRIDVVKGDELIVFVNLLGGNVARGDLAKNTG